MSIALIKLLVDFGLLVLIWMIQLIVYPSFKYYAPNNLITWHKIYTTRLSLIVIPLMVGQLGLAAYLALFFNQLVSSVSLLMIVLLWLSTFLQFVPRHLAISKGNITTPLLNELVQKNWIRTLGWSLVFMLQLFEVIQLL